MPGQIRVPGGIATRMTNTCCRRLGIPRQSYRNCEMHSSDSRKSGVPSSAELRLASRSDGLIQAVKSFTAPLPWLHIPPSMTTVNLTCGKVDIVVRGIAAS
eukprot:41504-Rhodomonas_salina.1